MIKPLALTFLLSTIATLGLQAAGPASDNGAQAPYQDGWTAGDNGGTGFGAWSTVFQGFIGSSTLNGPSGASAGIDTSGVSFGLYSNTGAPGFAQAIRPFSSSLGIGETFSLRMDNGTVGTNGLVGFALRNAANNSLFQFYFVGGTNSYTIDAGSQQSTSHGFTADGMTASFTLVTANTFSFSIQFQDNLSIETFTDTLANPGGAIDNFRLFSFNPNDTNGSQSDIFFNNIMVTAVPEPSSIALLAAPLLLGGWMMMRRRRA